MDILLEGKKEIIEKVKKKHPNHIEFIDRMFSIDPTSQGKYAKWIGDYLEKNITLLDTENIEGMINNVVIPFESNYRRIDDDIVEKFKDKLLDNGLKLEGDTFKDYKNIKKSPKDINSYSTPFYILIMLRVLEENKTRIEKERLAKKDVDKIFEDSNFLVVKPLSYAASCYYGRQTKWCTASTNTSANYDKYSREGNLYYFIDKKYPNDKVALYVEKDGKQLNKYVYDSADDEKGIQYLYDEFPELVNTINELTEQAPIINVLMNYKLGKINSKRLIGADIITGVEENLDRGESIIEFTFKDFDDYREVFDLSDDEKWFLDMINSHYSDYVYVDDYEWEAGYILRYFNDGNKTLLKEIMKYILPEYSNIDFDDDSAVEVMAKKLLKMFDSEISSIMNSYSMEMNRIAEIGVRNTIGSDLCEYFDSYGIKKIGDECFDVYGTTVNQLINLYDKYNPKNNTIKSLLFTITEDDGFTGGWQENIYEMIEHNSFDNEKFNNDVNWELDKILSKIEDDNLYVFDEYKELFDTITEKYKLGEWYKLPRDEDASFKINKISIEDLTISVTIRNKTGYKNYILEGIDDFYSLLYNYKLFDDY